MLKFVTVTFLVFLPAVFILAKADAQGYSGLENTLLILDKKGKPTGKTMTLQERMKALNIPGVSVAIFGEGKLQWAKAFGVCDNTTGTKVDTATLFQAASLSKPVTAVAMFAVAEQGLIKPDQDINLQLSSWKIKTNKFTLEQMPTPRMLAAHMGGLSVHGFRGYKQGDKLPGLIDILSGKAPANSPPVQVITAPGRKQSYSGGGYVVLQLLLQEKSGQDFAEFMNSTVLQPTGMHNSFFALTPPVSLAQATAKGHDHNGKLIPGGYHLFPEQAAAGLWTTAIDYANFLLNCSNALSHDAGLLTQKTIKEMLSNKPPGNGTGFGIEGEGTNLRFAHLGSNPGYYCYAASFIHTGNGIVVMTNADNGQRLIAEIMKTLYDLYNW